MAEEMSLDEALAVLCDVHIRRIEEDEHWNIPIGERPQPWNVDFYPRAWAAVRNHVLKVRGVQTVTPPNPLGLASTEGKDLAAIKAEIKAAGPGAIVELPRGVSPKDVA